MEPKTWKELMDLVDNNELPGPTPRQPGDELVYSSYIGSMDRVIALSILDEQIRMWQECYDCTKHCLLPNIFGYTKLLHYLPYVKHFVLWTDIEGKSPFYIKLQIYNWLSRMYGKRAVYPHLQILFYENKSSDKSIPEKPHYQVFVNFQNY
jgi:hypothetical protein